MRWTNATNRWDIVIGDLNSACGRWASGGSERQVIEKILNDQQPLCILTRFCICTSVSSTAARPLNGPALVVLAQPAATSPHTRITPFQPSAHKDELEGEDFDHRAPRNDGF